MLLGVVLTNDWLYIVYDLSMCYGCRSLTIMVIGLWKDLLCSWSLVVRKVLDLRMRMMRYVCTSRTISFYINSNSSPDMCMHAELYMCYRILMTYW